jgi:hypothetical protein
MFNFDTYLSAESSDRYHSYQHLAGPSEHDPDPLADCCCICYNPYSFATTDPQAEDVIRSPCGHVFGYKCFLKWAETSSTCPLCRTELDSQNEVDVAMLDHAYFSWQSHVDAGGEFEARYFDAQESCFAPAGEDVWLTIAYEEKYAMQKALEPGFCCFNLGRIHDFDCTEILDYPEKYASLEQLPPLMPLPPLEQYEYPLDLQQVKDNHFDELVNCHEQWITSYFDDEESEDDFAVSYLDVFPY